MVPKNNVAACIHLYDDEMVENNYEDIILQLGRLTTSYELFI
jgi:hypothetical protein